ncbi:MAG: carbohydrate-binding protein [Clostridia bacterium]|nr:carbohydrate-binding protein [Clostridia bacterium]
MITITAKTASGDVLAAASHDSEAMLCFDREYAPGDAIEITSDVRHLWVQTDVSVLPGEVCLPEGRMTWPVPAGEHRLAYRPGAFTEPRHIVTARAMTAKETAATRCLSRNPADLRGDTDFFPHCTANVETRNESVFAARNVVDGLRHNTFHGEWPFESWGIGAREDAWCLLDLGREVALESMALTLRADFPHDAYWVRGQVALSDGGTLDFSLDRTGERQYVSLSGHRARWLRLQRLIKSDDPSAFPALRQWEVFGRDLDK